MAKRNPLAAKVHAANVREHSINTRPCRDDGVRRRLDKDPLTIEDERAKSRKRKVYVSAKQRWLHEIFIRSRMDAERAAKREDFLPIKMYRPGSGAFTGRYQSTKED